MKFRKHQIEVKVGQTSTFTIMGTLPGLNEVINAARSNRYSGASQKKKATQLCAFWIIAGKVPKFEKPVKLSVSWYEPSRRRDMDNVAAGIKFILDALVETGRIQDDSQQWVTGIKHDVSCDKEKPRIEVTIIPTEY